MDTLTHLAHVAAAYALRAGLATVVQLALLLGAPLLLAAAMQPVALFAERALARLLSARLHWILVGAPSVALHELGHAAVALLFGHQVTGVKWFDFSGEDGARGRVDHQYDPSSPWQRTGRFFIGVAPVMLGALVLALAAWFVLRAPLPAPIARGGAPALDGLPALLVRQLSSAAHAVPGFAASLHPARWRTWAFLWLALVAGSAMRLSGSDVRSAVAGFAVVVALLLLVNLLTLWLGAYATAAALGASRALAIADVAVAVAIALQAIVTLAAWLLGFVLGAIGFRGGQRAAEAN